MKAKTAEQLGELVAAIAAGLEDDDLVGYVRAWLDLAEGRITGAERFRLVGDTSRVASPDRRRMLAVRLAGEQGKVTTSELADLAGVSRETARGDLVGLAADGLLEARGRRRWREYVRPEAVAGG